MTTIHDIAKECGLSIASVSNAINDNGKVSEVTKHIVLEKAKQLGYVPNEVARNLKMCQSNMIGVICEDLNVPRVPEILDGITEYCQMENLEILFTNLRVSNKIRKNHSHESINETVHKKIRAASSRQAAGVIYIALYQNYLDYFTDNRNIPLAVINANSSSSLTVLEDVRKGSHTAVSYLIKCGHIRIGMIAVKDALTTKKFVDGYQEALRKNAIPIAESCIVYGQGSREAGFCGANTLFRKNVQLSFV